ncbi:MAG: type II toxin-antitoxin system VapC family toxin [Myxococcota bacterium]
MIRAGEPVYVDTSAWVALALERDALHARALAAWDALERQGVRLRSTLPVVLETFTFVDRAANSATALAWREELEKLPRFALLQVTRVDLAAAWTWLERNDLHKLSAVDATSFAVMQRLRIRHAFTFDHHFASAGFELVG